MRQNPSILFSGLIIALSFTSCEKSLLLLSSDKVATFVVDGEVAYVNGVLGKTAHKRFEKFIEEHPDVKTLILEDVPGSMNDEYNVQTCELLYLKGISTKAMSYSEVASGGVDLLISGTTRTVDEGAKIGVHSWSSGDKEGIEYPIDSPEHQIFLDLFEVIGIDTAFYWYTLGAAPADSIHWMTESEIEYYNIRTE
jgi:hypothetical protein